MPRPSPLQLGRRWATTACEELEEASLDASMNFFSACFRLLSILTLCAEPTTHPVRVSTTWTSLIKGRGPLQEVARSGSNDAG